MGAVRVVARIAWFGIAWFPFDCGKSEPAAFWAMHELSFSNRRGCPPNTPRLPNRPRGATGATADLPGLRVRSNAVCPILGQKTHNRALNRCHKSSSFPACSRMNRTAEHDASGAERSEVERKLVFRIIFSHKATKAQRFFLRMVLVSFISVPSCLCESLF